MTNLKQQAVEMINYVPDEKMVYVIDILKWMNGLFNDNDVNLIKAREKEKKLKAWEGLKKYKGIIDRDINIKEELALAMEEKYARIN